MNSWFKNKITPEENDGKNLEHNSKDTKIRVFEASFFPRFYFIRHCDGQHKVIIPLQAKRVREFIEIRYKKISPTPILSTLGCM